MNLNNGFRMTWPVLKSECISWFHLLNVLISGGGCEGGDDYDDCEVSKVVDIYISKNHFFLD